MNICIHLSVYRILGFLTKENSSHPVFQKVSSTNIFIVSHILFQILISPHANEKYLLSSTESKEQGRYDIFTAPKGATYLIYGWLKFSDVPSKKVTLLQSFGGKPHVLRTKDANTTKIFFFEEVKMADNINISIELNFTFTDSLFHVYEICSD